MHKGMILLSMLVAVLASTALCEVAKIPATQDVYVSLGTGNEQVFNKTDILRCEINVTDFNSTRVRVYPGAPMIQFDISDLNITENDIGILVLRAKSIEKAGSDSAMVALLTIGSEWEENSDLSMLLLNILPAWNIINKNDLTLMSTDSDGDKIFAFDVSRKLLKAKAEGDQISFLLEAVSNSSYRANFFASESGQGPYLIVMPYPGKLMVNQTAANQGSTANQTSSANRSSMVNRIPGANETSISNQTSGDNKPLTANQLLGARQTSMANATPGMPFNESLMSPLNKEAEFKNAILQEMKSRNVQTSAPLSDDML